MATVTFSLREDAHPSELGGGSAGPQTDHLGDYLPDRIEFVDAQGHPMTWLLPFNHFHQLVPNSQGELNVQVFVNGTVPAAQLHIYQLYRLKTEIPFEFSDVPGAMNKGFRRFPP